MFCLLDERVMSSRDDQNSWLGKMVACILLYMYIIYHDLMNIQGRIIISN